MFGWRTVQTAKVNVMLQFMMRSRVPRPLGLCVNVGSYQSELSGSGDEEDVGSDIRAIRARGIKVRSVETARVIGKRDGI